MSELKVHKAYNRWIDEEMPTPNDDLICNEFYLKSEADKVIAELKSALKESEEARYEAGADAADYYQENRRLKRALWLARADRGRDNSILLPSKFMRNVWDNVERKCLAKAEQYK